MPIFPTEPKAVFNARLTLSSSLPVPTSDLANQGTLYLLPYKGCQIGLVDGGGGVVVHDLGASGVSIASSGLDLLRVYDAFVYDNAGTLTLELTGWLQTTATSSPSSGSSVTINVPDTGNVAAGDLISVVDGSNEEVAIVESVVADTSITVETLANSYTTPTVNFLQERGTALEVSDVGFVKSGATTRRYCGSVMTVDSTGAKFTDVGDPGAGTAPSRLVWNYYNRVRRNFRVREDSLSVAYSTSDYRAWFNNTENRADVLIGVREDAVQATFAGNFSGNCGIGIAVDTSTPTDPESTTAYVNTSETAIPGLAAYDDQPGLGYRQLCIVEIAFASSTIFGDDTTAGDHYLQAGMTGHVLG